MLGQLVRAGHAALQEPFQLLQRHQLPHSPTVGPFLAPPLLAQVAVHRIKAAGEAVAHLVGQTGGLPGAVLQFVHIHADKAVGGGNGSELFHGEIADLQVI